MLASGASWTVSVTAASRGGLLSWRGLRVIMVGGPIKPIWLLDGQSD